MSTQTDSSLAVIEPYEMPSQLRPPLKCLLIHLDWLILRDFEVGWDAWSITFNKND